MMRWKQCFRSKTCVTVLALTVVLLLSVFYLADLDSLTNEVSYRISKHVYHFTDERTPPLASVSGPYLTLRSVYHDPRRRYNYNGAYVLMIEVAKPLLNRHLIVGCGVGGYNSSTFKVHPLNINGWVGKYLDERPALTHTMATVDCFNLPPNIANGSKATISYRTIHGGEVLGVVSERPLVLSETTASRPCKIAACLAVAYGRPPFLDNWLRYQKSIGVTHVHVIAEPSFVSEGSLSEAFVADSVRNGFVSVDVWEPHLASGVHIHYHSQLLAYHDCIYRFAPLCEYMSFADQDDFFVPLAPNAVSLVYYVDRLCHRGSCAFDWVEMYPECGMSSRERSDGNLTALLLSPRQKTMPFKKCIHRLRAVVEVGIHDARELVSGFETVEVPTWEGYVAHLRKHRLPSDGKCF